MRLTQNQKSFAADKMVDSANDSLAGLVFGRSITATVRPLLLVLGLLLYFGE
jgi:hypothetical protein